MKVKCFLSQIQVEQLSESHVLDTKIERITFTWRKFSIIYGAKYSRTDQVIFVEYRLAEFYLVHF